MLEFIKNRNLGKYLLISTLLIVGIYCNVSSYNLIMQDDDSHFEKGTVLAKNDPISGGKYPRQKYIISFKYDKPEYGVHDIEVSFSTFAQLNAGDRTSFKVSPNRSNSHVLREMLISFIALVFDFCVGAFILFLIIEAIQYIWNF